MKERARSKGREERTNCEKDDGAQREKRTAAAQRHSSRKRAISCCLRATVAPAVVGAAVKLLLVVVARREERRRRKPENELSPALRPSTAATKYALSPVAEGEGGELAAFAAFSRSRLLAYRRRVLRLRIDTRTRTRTPLTHTPGGRESVLQLLLPSSHRHN